MKTLIRKLSSRKLWAAIVGVVFGVAVALGVSPSEIEPIAAAVQRIAGMAGAIASCIAYILGEAKADAANVSGAAYPAPLPLTDPADSACENLGVTESEYGK